MADILYNKAIDRDINESLIRRTLSRHESFTKTTLSRETGLSFPTVSRIVDDMKERGEIRYSGKDPKTGGRHAQAYELSPDYAYVICLYVENISTVGAMVVNAVGAVTETCFQPVRPRASEKKPGPAIIRAMDILIRRKIKKYPVRALTAALPWGVSSGTILFGAEEIGLKGFPVETHWKEAFGLSVRVENDMNAIAAGCYQRMYLRGEQASLACISFSESGCGCGLYVRGHLVRGVNGFAGELRYLPLSSETNIDSLFTGGMTPRRAAAALAQMVASLCAVIDTGNIVIYRRPITEKAFPLIAPLLSRFLPEGVSPSLILSGTYHEDFRKGLIGYGSELLMSGYTIINR